MNGHFEVDNNAYPIGPLRVGNGYKVTDMRNLTTLHSHPISQEQASSICKDINADIRAGAQYLKNGNEQSLVGAVALELCKHGLPL